jgi:hypothetical protein
MALPNDDKVTSTQTVRVKYTEYGEYQYFGTFVVSLGQRLPTDSGVTLLRIWADDQLIYDLYAGLSLPGMAFNFFNGAEDQGEVFHGMHYRGLMCIYFHELPLKNFGSRIPAISAEISDNSDRSDITVGALMRAYCLKAGYADEDIFTSDIDTLPVAGFVSSDGGSLANVINQFASLYGFTWVERNDQILFTRREIADTPLTIDMVANAEDMAQLSEREGNPQIVVIKRTDDSSFPKSISLTYLNVDADYKAGYEIAKRNSSPYPTNKAMAPLDLTMSVSLHPNQVLGMLYDAIYRVWSSKLGYSIRLPIKFIALDPGDILQFTANGTVYEAMVTSQIINADNSLSISLAEVAGVTYATQVETQPTVVNTNLAYGLPVRAILIDVPDTDPDMLVDGQLNLLLLMSGYGENDFTSGRLDMTPMTNPETFTPRASSSVACKIGTLLNTPTAIDFPFEYDNTNAFRILRGSIPVGRFEAHTNDELEADPTLNLMVVGRGGVWEFIQFGAFEIIDADTVEITHLLRGRFGTENTVNNHSTNDTIAFLDDAVKVPYTVADYRADVGYLWRVLSPGQPTWSVDAQVLLPSGASRKPYAPVQASARLDTVTGDVWLTWTRRARFQNTPPDPFDPSPPLDELVEQYEIDFLNAAGTAGVRREIGIGGPSFRYTAAMRLADGIDAVPTQINALIYQVNASHSGRGFAGGGFLHIAQKIEMEGAINGTGNLDGAMSGGFANYYLAGSISGGGNLSDYFAEDDLVGTISGGGRLTAAMTGGVSATYLEGSISGRGKLTGTFLHYYIIGNPTWDGGNSFFGGGIWFGNKYTVDNDAYITAVDILMIEAETNIYAVPAIYTDNSGVPQKRLGYGGQTPNVPVGVSELPLNGPVYVRAGDVIWVGVVMADTGGIRVATSTGDNSKYFLQSSYVNPVPFDPAGSASGWGAHLTIYAKAIEGGAGALPALVRDGTAQTATDTNAGDPVLIFTRPSVLAVGDIMVAIVGTTSPNLVTTGWTQQEKISTTITTGVTGYLYLLTRVANSGDVAASTISLEFDDIGASNVALGMLLDIAFASTVGDHKSAVGAGANPTLPALSGEFKDVAIVANFAYGSTISAVAGASGSSMQPLQFGPDHVSNGSYYLHVVENQSLFPSGDTGTVTFTKSTSDASLSVGVTIKG